MHVIFLHRGSASKDGMEQDGECQQGQWRKQTKRPVLCGEAKQEGAVSFASREQTRRTDGAPPWLAGASSAQTGAGAVPNDGSGG